MRAAFYEATGPAHQVLQLGELPTPQPGPGEVRVKIVCSGINPSDVKTRAGLRGKTLPFARIVPHSDGAGVIDRVGDGVSAGRVGERVWIWNAAWGRPSGTAAEYVVLPAAQAVALPVTVDYAAGACLGIPALTAYHAVKTDGGVTGRDVLIAGGAGAVGHYAIQFARLLGAGQIVATVGSDANAALALAAGADATVNYKNEDVAARVLALTQGQGVDRVIETDLGANMSIDHQVLKQNGELVIYGSSSHEIAVPFLPMILKNVGMRFFIVYNLPPPARARAIAHLTALLLRGDLQHNVAHTLPLERIADAHDLVAGGHAGGNVVLTVGDGAC